MTSLSTIPPNHARRTRRGAPASPRRARIAPPRQARLAIPGPPDNATPSAGRPFELIDAKAASRLLGVPHTWLLAQARERRIPHHRLGHYVRFDPEDLRAWLRETRSMPTGRR